MMAVDPENRSRNLEYLTEAIGVRLAGMSGEAAAADYLLKEFEAMGISAWLEEFPVTTWDVQSQELQFYHGGDWHAVGCSLFAKTPGKEGEWVDAPLVFFEGATGYQREDLSSLLADKIVIHLGCHIEAQENYRRLIEANPVGLLMVDDRFTGAEPLADAIFPTYAANCGTVPTLNLAFQEAWSCQEKKASRARFRVVGVHVLPDQPMWWPSCRGATRRQES